MKNDFPAYDVVVCGGGFAGLGAAFALSKKKLKVLVLEPSPSIGGEITRAYSLNIASGISPLADKLLEKIDKAGGKKGNRIDAVVAELCLLKMAEGKFDILLYCQPTGIIRDGEKTLGIVVSGKSGQFPVQSRALVDATGNSLLFKYAGVEVPEPGKVSRIYSIFMNGIENRDSLPGKFTCGKSQIIIRNSIWDGECSFEFLSDSDKPQYSRLMIPKILETARKEFPQLKNALMSHAAISELQLATFGKGKEKVPESSSGIFSTGIASAEKFSLENRDGLVPELILSGEKAAKLLISETDLKVKLPKIDDIPVSSVIASPSIRKDVVVCGGGTAGAVAAITSAREGAKTLLVESSCCLGGAATGGAINSFYHGVKGGIQDEIDARIEKMSSLFLGPSVLWKNAFHPDLKKIVLQEMLIEAGAEMIFESTACGVETEPVKSLLPAKRGAKSTRRIKSAVIAGPSGCANVTADVFIDSTGDADLAAMAGADFIFGRVSDGMPHAYSQSSSSIRRDDKGNLVIGHNNFDAGYCDPTDPRDFTRARIAGLKLYWREKFDDPSRLTTLAEQIGLRNSRLIKGDCTITFADQIVCREYPDVIGYTYANYDNHAVDYENESPQTMIWCWGLGNWRALIGSEIPYRAILPAGIEGLLIACRALSVDFDGHNQLRMQRDLQRVGEAAGIAAAMAVKSGKTPRNIDVKKLQEKLFKSGALLDSGKGYHTNSWKPENLFSLTHNQLRIGDKDSGSVKWIAQSTTDEKSLTSRMNSGDIKESTMSAILLGTAGKKEALEKLLACVKEKSDIRADGERSTPFWKPAIAVLGWNKCADAVPLLEDILLDKTSDQPALVLALNALGNIGNRKSASAIKKMLSRKDLPAEQIFKKSGGSIPAVKENALWKIELTAAANLAKLGCPDRKLAEKYLSDERLPVRKFAQRLLE
ncbi:MAG TPA: hypothetical protein DCZ94_02500 [Lentisphaeria bacterium]|nr:MAG: hypothetical protein A2X48_21730 [Lentisphaerae bacterium GWF2_49_21]HBC85805.1 hypothetical protein [Lentisphaeria bacterium]